ncbi:hypothetical protein [Streptomyces sp. KHY 26]|uniref:hypothetical protein n=1 Tax=Streptomyces sp. KHY 26 TaxID=3097359 RepID=UPI00376EB619
MTAQPRAVLVEWISGTCWKCERTGLLVTWVGPARLDGQHAPIYLCQSCLAAVERRAARYFMDHYYNEALPVVVVRPYLPPPLPEGRPMSTQQIPRPVQTVQYVAISVGAFGFRARAEGRTGLDAWRVIRTRHPRVTWAAGAYGLLLLGVAAVVLARLVT